MNATAVIDTADILLAQPIAVRPGESIDLSGTPLSVAFAPILGGGVVMSASTEDGTLAFVGGEAPYFRIDLPVAGRTWRIAKPTAVRGDILRRPDPAHPAQVEWLGRVDLLVQPGSNSSAIALKAQAPILLDRQPYDGRIVTAPMVVGPQGAIDRSYTDEQVVALKGGADTGHDSLKKLGDLISGLSIAGVQGLAQALAGKATPADITAAVNGLLSGAGPAYDTLKELQDLIINDETAITALSALVALKASKAELAAHATDLANPHGVTKAQVGLANVANLAPADLPVSTAQAAAIATAIANLVASSPAALDTLNELATALGNDPNFAATITAALGQKANTADLGNAAYKQVGTTTGTVADGKVVADLSGVVAGKASLGHTAAPDADYQALPTDVQVGFAVLSAPRTVYLPDVDAYPLGQVLFIADESGQCSPDRPITITVGPGTNDTISGAAGYLLADPYQGIGFRRGAANVWIIAR